MRDEKVCWVAFESEATEHAEVAWAYREIAISDGRVHNLYKALSLSPGAILPADRLYRQLMHSDDCPFEPWLRELIAVQVAMICGSRYAVVHHGENVHEFFGDRRASEALLESLRRGDWPEAVESSRLRAILSFNEKLSLNPESIGPEDLARLREVALVDKEIVYLAQISASFAYWSRIINALGIAVGDEPIGLTGKGQ